MRPFASLTAGGQARRLRTLAEQAISKYGLRVNRLHLITNASNAIYRVECRSGGPYVLRVANPTGCNGPEVIDLELSWLDALDRDTDVGALRPIALPDGRRFVTVDAPGIPEPRHCIVYSWVPGYTLGERVTPANAEAWGKLSAQLHQHASSFRKGRSRSVRPYDRVYAYSNDAFDPSEAVAVRLSKFKEYFPTSRRRAYERAAKKIQNVIDALWSNPRRIHLFHADLHPWNIRIDKGRARPIDFEDLLKGHPVQDIAISLHYIRHDSDYPIRRAAFQRGYETVLPWPVPDEGSLEALIAGRSLVLMNWVVNSSPIDPSMREVAPGYLDKVDERVGAYLKTGRVGSLES